MIEHLLRAQDSRQYVGIDDSKVTGADLSSNSSSTDPNTAYHLDAGAFIEKVGNFSR